MKEMCIQVAVTHECDVLSARRQGRQMAEEIGFSGYERVLIATAISEVTRNILTYAGQGQVVLQTVWTTQSPGLRVVASDQGPGIADIEKAMADGYSTGGSLGFGLPGARRLMDDFVIVSELGKGTVVTLTKWLKK